MSRLHAVSSRKALSAQHPTYCHRSPPSTSTPKNSPPYPRQTPCRRTSICTVEDCISSCPGGMFALLKHSLAFPPLLDSDQRVCCMKSGGRLCYVLGHHLFESRLRRLGYLSSPLQVLVGRDLFRNHKLNGSRERTRGGFHIDRNDVPDTFRPRDICAPSAVG